MQDIDHKRQHLVIFVYKHVTRITSRWSYCTVQIPDIVSFGPSYSQGCLNTPSSVTPLTWYFLISTVMIIIIMTMKNSEKPGWEPNYLHIAKRLSDKLTNLHNTVQTR